MFWRLLEREADWLPPWRDLLRVYRRLEARGEIRGGRFVAGFAGEQYALPDAVGLLRDTRRKAGSGEWVSLSGADPLNLAGILTPGAKLAALTGNRLLYRDGLPVALFAGGAVQFLETLDPGSEWEARKALLRGAVPAEPRRHALSRMVEATRCTAVVIGASSGIGEALARQLAADGWRVALLARRVAKLEAIAKELGGDALPRPLDLADAEEAAAKLDGVIRELNGADLIVISSGTGYPNEALDWPPDRETLAVNVVGFTAVAQTAMRHFLERGRGHLVGITSLAALRAFGETGSYAGSKAFQSIYLRLAAASRRSPSAADHRHRGATRFRRHADDEVAHGVLGRFSRGRGAADHRSDPAPPEACLCHPALGHRRLPAALPAAAGLSGLTARGGVLP